MSWPLANSSLSEGEVPMSPGDARWHAFYANKMKPAMEGCGLVTEGCGLDSTVQAFLEFKSSPDPSSDSSQFSDSQLNVRVVR